MAKVTTVEHAQEKPRLDTSVYNLLQSWRAQASILQNEAKRGHGDVYRVSRELELDVLMRCIRELTAAQVDSER